MIGTKPMTESLQKLTLVSNLEEENSPLEYKLNVD